MRDRYIAIGGGVTLLLLLLLIDSTALPNLRTHFVKMIFYRTATEVQLCFEQFYKKSFSKNLCPLQGASCLAA